MISSSNFQPLHLKKIQRKPSYLLVFYRCMPCHAIFDQTSSSHLSCQFLQNKLQAHPHPSWCSLTLFYPTTSMSLRQITPFIIASVVFHMTFSHQYPGVGVFFLNVHFTIIFFAIKREKGMPITCMCFVQANPERAVAAMKHFHVALNERLFGWILNTRQNATLKKAKKKNHKRIILPHIFFFLKLISLNDFLPCLTQLPAALAHSISSVINK